MIQYKFLQDLLTKVKSWLTGLANLCCLICNEC